MVFFYENDLVSHGKWGSKGWNDSCSLPCCSAAFWTRNLTHFHRSIHEILSPCQCFLYLHLMLPSDMTNEEYLEYWLLPPWGKASTVPKFLSRQKFLSSSLFFPLSHDFISCSISTRSFVRFFPLFSSDPRLSLTFVRSIPQNRRHGSIRSFLCFLKEHF